MRDVVEATVHESFDECELSLEPLRAAGAKLAISLRMGGRSHGSRAIRNDWLAAEAGLNRVWAGMRALPAQIRAASEGLRCLRESQRLLKAALLETKDLLKESREWPVASSYEHPSGPRVSTVAEMLLRTAEFRFEEAPALAFLERFQSLQDLDITELWALKPVLQLTLLIQIAELGKLVLGAPQQQFPDLLEMLASLRRIGEADWKAFFESASGTERRLRQDPSGIYPRMDFESRDTYRAAVVHLARHSNASEAQVVEVALELARQSELQPAMGPQWKERLEHVGYYLVDDGRVLLEERVGYRPPLIARLRRVLRTYPNGAYLVGIELATFLILLCVLGALSHRAPVLAGFLLLLIPATQSAVELMNHLMTFLLPASRLPKLDLSDGVPDEYRTIVAVPALLLDEARVHQLVEDLEVRFLANPDPNIHYLLLTDSPDSSQRFDEKDGLALLCGQLIAALNRKYGWQKCGGFLLLHRNRVYYESERAWLGWERKRGKLLALNQLLRNGPDSFAVKEGDLSILPGVRYVITLDADTQLPRGAAHRLIGAIAHPLNRAIIDPRTNIVVKGYGILQPRVGVSVQSVARSRLAGFYSGQTGFDIYTRASSDVYQDLYGEGIFTGKGIYDVDALRAVLEQRFPGSALLSHDLIEGAYARAGLVSDIEVIDDYPTHFSAYSRRKHRWVRGDWQTLSWLFDRVPDESGRPVPNPISVVSRWKIVDNLRRSLIEPATLALLLAGWFYLPGGAGYWTRTSLVLLLLPVALQLAFLTIRFLRRPEPTTMRDTAAQTGIIVLNVVLGVVFLAHQALVGLDAIVRSNVRRSLTRKRMLEWETAAEAEMNGKKNTPVDFYLEWMPVLAGGIAILLWLVNRGALAMAWPFLVLWASSGFVTRWLNLPPSARHSQVSRPDQELLRHEALRTWRYFRNFSTARTNWLIPDNVQETPARIAYRISPTNLGLLLNARLAACDLGFCTLSEFVEQTTETLGSMERMPRFRGHFYNWYDTQTLTPLGLRFVSTVDSGNLAGALWTLKQACRELRDAPLFRPSLWQALRDHLRLLQGLSTDYTEFGARVEPLGNEAGAWLRELPRLEADLLRRQHQQSEEIAWWGRETVARLHGLRRLVNDFAPWLLPEYESLGSLIEEAAPKNLAELTLRTVPVWTSRILEALSRAGTNPLARSLAARLETSAWNAAMRGDQLECLASSAERFVQEMDFSLVFNPRRKLLSIGYDASEGRLEPSMYDLLASEARLACFVAVAKGDVPQECWFRLGRTLTAYRGKQLLLSWTGTMFEYLMPSLWMRSYPDTLLDRSLRAMLRCQRIYARSKRVPWGISESAYAYRDETGDYQYQAFGIPALALKENTSRAVVVSPYSTFLALAVDPPAALKNLRKMRSMNWAGPFGYYESADYTAAAVAGGLGEPELVRCWMAHHQGMILLSICNLLCGAPMQQRFHAEPRVMATELILHERAVTARVVNAGHEVEADTPAFEAVAAVSA